MDWTTWSRMEWAAWGLDHPWTLAITPTVIAVLYVISKIRSK